MRRLQQISEIGCCRAAEFGVSAALITGILRVSRKRLLAVGITMRELRQAAGGVSNARRTLATVTAGADVTGFDQIFRQQLAVSRTGSSPAA